MYKKTITYVDYNGNSRTEDHHFNLTKAEIAKMELSVSGGYAEMIQRIIAAQDQPALMEVFESLIIKSYGVKTPDGRGFDKDPQHVKSFMQTEAYSQFFMSLATDSKEASEFINNIFPADLVEQLEATNPN